MKTIVLVPALNEGPRIGALVTAIANALPSVTTLVVDGGSRDETRARAQAAGAEVIPQEGRGYAAALRSGYRAARSRGADRLLQLDADGQHPPDHGPRLLAALGGADLVIGSRHGTRSTGGMGRRWGNRLLREWVAWNLHHAGIAGPTPQDVTSGYLALNRRALDALCDHLPEDVADANLRVLALRLRLQVVETPVPMPERSGGTSMHGGWRGLRNLGRSLHAVARDAHRSLP